MNKARDGESGSTVLIPDVLGEFLSAETHTVTCAEL